MKAQAAVLLAGALLLSCCTLPSTAFCANPSNPQHCKGEGERCISKRTSECIPPLECPVELGAQGWCTRTSNVLPCGEPPIHCKPNGAACALAKVSECIEGNYCDRLMGICVKGEPPKSKPNGKKLTMELSSHGVSRL
jgi:hypothetical protein